MNTLIEKDIDIFFNQQVFINSTISNTNVYTLLMVDNNLKIKNIFHERVKKQFTIYTRDEYSIFTIDEDHLFYDCIFNYIVTYKLSDLGKGNFQVNVNESY